MTFNFEINEIVNARTIKLSGRLDSNTSGLIEKDILNLFEEADQLNVLLNFTELNYISSAGLRVIILASKKANEKNGRLILFSLSPDVRSVFEISGLLKILQIVDNYDIALSLLEINSQTH